MAKARNRNLGGIAALGALGLAMARLGKREPGDSGPTPENRGDMMAAPAAARDYSREIAEHEGGIGLTTPDRVSNAGPASGGRVQSNRLLNTDADFPPVRTSASRNMRASSKEQAQLDAMHSRGRRYDDPRNVGMKESAESETRGTMAPARAAASAASAAQPARAASAAQPASSPQAAPAASAARSDSKGLTLGTPTRPAPGAPSIYAGPEAWAAYRQRQAAGMKKGGTVKMASGGSVGSASKRGDGIALRGKTRGKLV